MNPPNSLWVDGEQIPDDRIEDIFHPPPGLPLRFLRSALIVGARGVGKTTLFRYQKCIHSGVAIHISLATEFATLTRQTGFGPLATDVPRELEAAIIGKASSLLALSVAERLARRGMSIPREALIQCLPSVVRQTLDTLTPEHLFQMKTDVAVTPLKAFEHLAAERPLPRLVSALGEAIGQSHGPFLLLLDRADMVLAPSLTPVIELLDQSTHFIALIAMRPGHAGQTIADVSNNAIAGDSYSVMHLGMLPRSQQWRAFAEAAIAAQLGPVLLTIPDELRGMIISVSRDSLRIALELFARYVSVPPGQSKEELITAIEDCRENQLLAAQRVLQSFHPNFRGLVARMRQDAIKRFSRNGNPLLLAIEARPVESLFETATRSSKFVDAGLRCGALCMPEGLRWTPGISPAEVEIPPILLWDRADGFAIREKTPEPITLRINETEMLRASGGRPKTPSIFVAFRMRISESMRFRRDIEQAIRKHHRLNAFQVLDGHVPAGATWAKIIRERIRGASAVVGDISGMSSEVLFELGFAYGLKKIIIPAVADPSEVSVLPPWLGETQLGHYTNEAGINGLLASIESHLIDPEFSRVASPAQPIPSLIVWLRTLSWNAHAFEQASSAVQREGLRIETFSSGTPQEIVLRRAASAALLIVSLDGTPDDALLHFVCGAIAAKPIAGYGTLRRSVLIIEEPRQTGRSFVAESVRRCSDIVQVAPLNNIREGVIAFCKEYLRWSSNPKRPRRKK